MVVAETYAGLNAIKTAFDMAKALKDIHSATERDRVVLDLQREILSAQEQQSALLHRVHELEEKVARSDAWEAEKKRYQLKDCGSNTFAYELKATEANGEPIHLACANCYQKGQIAILQFSLRSENQDWYECPACKNRRGYGTRVRRDINSERGPEYF